MAVAIQSNLVHLKAVDARRRGIRPSAHEIAVASPGPVDQYGETRIDRAAAERYSDPELALRLHEVWGQFCLMQWLFGFGDIGRPCNFGSLGGDAEVRCDSVLAVKHAEVHAMLWRLRFEQRRPQDAACAQSVQGLTDRLTGEGIPVRPFGKSVDDCSDLEILLCACEYAGMLGTIRWVMDARLAWGAPGIMEVGDDPFF